MSHRSLQSVLPDISNNVSLLLCVTGRQSVFCLENVVCTENVQLFCVVLLKISVLLNGHDAVSYVYS